MMKNTERIGAIAAGVGIGLTALYAITGANVLKDIYGGLRGDLKQSAESKRGCGCGSASASETKIETPNIPMGSRGRRQMASEYSLDRVNPVVVEGAEDVYGAEEGYSPSLKPSLKMW